MIGRSKAPLSNLRRLAPDSLLCSVRYVRLRLKASWPRESNCEYRWPDLCHRKGGEAAAGRQSRPWPSRGQRPLLAALFGSSLSHQPLLNMRLRDPFRQTWTASHHQRHPVLIKACPDWPAMSIVSGLLCDLVQRPEHFKVGLEDAAFLQGVLGRSEFRLKPDTVFLLQRQSSCHRPLTEPQALACSVCRLEAVTHRNC